MIRSILVSLALLPSVALAQTHIVDANLEMTSDAFEVRLATDRLLGEPRVRSEPGFVRVWFPVASPLNLDRDGDGQAVRFVRIRPGADETALIVVRLGDMRDVGRAAIDIARTNEGATIRIARSSLAAVAVPAPTPTPAPAAAPATTAAAAEPAAHEAAPAPAPAAEPAAPAAAPTLALAQRPTAASLLQAPEGPSTTTILILVCAVLGGAYLVVRSLRKKQANNDPHRSIEVVAHKRLGARHQVMVVRALGHDHLISVSAGRTEKLASVPSPEPTENGKDAPDEGLLAMLRRTGSDERPSNAPLHRSKPPEERPRFGAELIRAAQERTEADRVSISAPASDSVAGLLRLREQLGR